MTPGSRGQLHIKVAKGVGVGVGVGGGGGGGGGGGLICGILRYIAPIENLQN